MMTAEQLLGSIFERALQGKLVEQRVSEGTGEDLFQKIQAEKQRLIKSGELKKSKPVEPITEDEIPFDIPETWKWVRVESIVTLNPKNELADDIETAFIPMTLVDDGYSNRHTFEVRKWGEIKKGFSHFADGDIGVAKITPCFQNRKSVIFKNLINGFGAGTTELTIVRPFTDSCCPEYLLAAFKSESFIKKGMKSFTGTAGQQRIHKDFLRTYVMPLPPLEEQKRIVAKIEELMPFVEQYAKASTRLNTLNASFPEQIKKSILQQAVMGKLVPQDPNDEPASVLLKKITEEKQELIKEGKVKKSPRYEQSEVPFEIPNNWEWARLYDVLNFIDYRGKTPVKLTQGVDLIGAWNIKKGYLDMSINHTYISQEEFESRKSRGLTQNGDILFITEGGTMGNACLNALDGECSCGQRVITMQAYEQGMVCNEYFMYVLLSPYFQLMIKENATGSAAMGIKAATLKTFWVPVPPIKEQRRIVDRLHKAFAFCKELE